MSFDTYLITEHNSGRGVPEYVLDEEEIDELGRLVLNISLVENGTPHIKVYKDEVRTYSLETTIKVYDMDKLSLIGFVPRSEIVTIDNKLTTLDIPSKAVESVRNLIGTVPTETELGFIEQTEEFVKDRGVRLSIKTTSYPANVALKRLTERGYNGG